MERQRRSDPERGPRVRRSSARISRVAAESATRRRRSGPRRGAAPRPPRGSHEALGPPDRRVHRIFGHGADSERSARRSTTRTSRVPSGRRKLSADSIQGSAITRPRPLGRRVGRAGRPALASSARAIDSGVRTTVPSTATRASGTRGSQSRSKSGRAATKPSPRARNVQAGTTQSGKRSEGHDARGVARRGPTAAELGVAADRADRSRRLRAGDAPRRVSGVARPRGRRLATGAGRRDRAVDREELVSARRLRPQRTGRRRLGVARMSPGSRRASIEMRAGALRAQAASTAGGAPRPSPDRPFRSRCKTGTVMPPSPPVRTSDWLPRPGS